MSSQHKPLFALALLLVLYVAFTIGVGRFTATDEIAFKAAGREWATHGRFAAPELSGFGEFDPPVEVIWFAHLPVYTFLFGVFVKVFGFGVWQSNAYDALIHVALVILTYRLARQWLANAWPAAIAAAAVIPIANPGRADELAIVFGLGALLCINRRRFAFAGVLFGLCAATSAVAAFLIGLCAIVPIVEQKQFVRATLIIIATSAIACLACFAPILIAHPDAIRQFGSHAGHQFSSSLTWGITHSWIYGKQYILPAGAALLLALFAPRKLRLIGPAIAMAIVVLLVPAKSYYLWYVTPIVFALAATTTHKLTAIAALALYAWGIVIPVRQMLIVATLPTSQRLAPNVATIERTIEKNSIVLGSEFWSATANDLRYRSLVHANVDFDTVDYVILVSNGSGAPGKPQTLTPEQDAAIASKFVVVVDDLPRDVPRLFGVPLSHSAWGYGVRILKRR